MDNENRARGGRERGDVATHAANDEAGAAKTMKSRGALIVLLLVIFVDMAGFGIVIPFLPFWAEHFGAKPEVVTLLMASYALMQFLFAAPWGWASDRWGRKPVLLASITGSVLSFAWLAFANALWMLFAARMLAGIMGANIAVAQAYIADVTPGESRAKGMGLLGVALGFGFILGPAIGGLLATPAAAAAADFEVPLLAGAGVALLSLILAVIFLGEPDRHRVVMAENLAPGARLRAFAIVLGHPAVAQPILIMGLISFVMGGVEATFALWAERQFQWGPRETGYFLAYIGICMAVAQGGMVGPLARRLGEATLAAGALVIFAAGIALLPLSNTLAMVLLAGLLMALGLGLGQPTLSGMISRNSPEEAQGSVMGAAQSAQSLARIFGPVIAGLLFATFGRQSPYEVGAAIIAVAVILALRLRTRLGKTANAAGR